MRRLRTRGIGGNDQQLRLKWRGIADIAHIVAIAIYGNILVELIG